MKNYAANGGESGSKGFALREGRYEIDCTGDRVFSVDLIWRTYDAGYGQQRPQLINLGDGSGI
jgi:hypothetical protein